MFKKGFYFVLVGILFLFFISCSHKKVSDNKDKVENNKKTEVNQELKKDQANKDKDGKNNLKLYHLTQEKLDKLIVAIPDLRKKGLFKFSDNQSPMKNFMEAQKYIKELDKQAKKYGFKDKEDMFLGISKLIYIYSYINLQNARQKALKGFEKMKKQLDNNLKNPNIPANVKQQLKEQFKKLESGAKDFDKQIDEYKQYFTDKELNLVKKNLDKIKEIF